MSKRSPARIPYILLFGTIAQFQLNNYNIEPFAKPGNPRGARGLSGTVKTLKPPPKTENPPGPGKIHQGSP